MSDRPLNQSFEATGKWYLPDSPDRVVVGDLRYTPNGTELDLHEPFQAMRGVISTSDKQPKYSTIHGITREGEAMTLLNAQRMGGSFNFGSGGFREAEKVFSVWLLVGAHLPSDFAFPKVSFRIPGLQIWLSRATIEQSFERDETTRESTHSYRVHGWKGERFRVSSIDATIEWGTSRLSSADAFTSIAVTVSGWLTIQPDEPEAIEWYIEQQSKVATMLAFLAGTPMSPDLIEASIDDSTRRVSVMVTLRDAKYCSYKNHHEFFMPRGAMTVDLPTVLSNWFAVYEKINKPSQLALSVLGSEKLWMHVEFLSLIQALEGFHRALIDGNYMPEDKYDVVKKVLGEAIPADVADDHRAALRARVRYGNQFSLRKRLDELADRLSEPIRLTIFGRHSKVPGQWVDTRNFYTHWDEALSSNILDGAGMYDATVRLRHFLRALYLDLMGIPQQAIHVSLGNASSSSQHLMQVNAAERRAADPSDMSGAFMSIMPQGAETVSGTPSAPGDATDIQEDQPDTGVGPPEQSNRGIGGGMLFLFVVVALVILAAVALFKQFA